MKTFLSLLGLIFGALIVLACIGLVVFWIYWWFLGLFTLGATWFNLPYWGTFIAIFSVALVARHIFVIFTVIGLVGWIWVLNWHWYTGIAVYLPTIATLFISFIITIVVAAFALVVQLFENVSSNRRRRK